MEHKDLYSTKDLLLERKRLYEKQNKIDPILEEEILFSDTVCDHDHATQHTRAALHRQTNAFEGKVINAYRRHLEWLTNQDITDILRNLATYLDQDYTDNPNHPAWIKRVTIDFGKLKAEQQVAILVKMQLEPKTNGATRKLQFTKAIKTKQYSFKQIKEYINEV